MNLDALLELLGQLGLAVGATVALFYAVLVGRRDRDGRPRSALVVPGWQHDAALAETERIRQAYEARLLDTQREADARQAEWRRLRDEERVRAAEADERLSASTAVLRELVTVIHEARTEVARLAGVTAGTGQRGGGSDA